nr:uncharacterized protein LOC112939394 isoform X2 [Oryza sativa Japonica Group]
MQRTKSSQPKKLILATTLLSNSPHCSRSPHPGRELAEKHSASATGGRRRLSSLRRRCRLCFSDSRGCRLAQVLNPIAHEMVLKITGFGGCGGGSGGRRTRVGDGGRRRRWPPVGFSFCSRAAAASVRRHAEAGRGRRGLGRGGGGGSPDNYTSCTRRRRISACVAAELGVDLTKLLRRRSNRCRGRHGFGPHGGEADAGAGERTRWWEDELQAWEGIFPWANLEFLRVLRARGHGRPSTDAHSARSSRFFGGAWIRPSKVARCSAWGRATKFGPGSTRHVGQNPPWRPRSTGPWWSTARIESCLFFPGQ